MLTSKFFLLFFFYVSNSFLVIISFFLLLPKRPAILFLCITDIQADRNSISMYINIFTYPFPKHEAHVEWVKGWLNFQVAREWQCEHRVCWAYAIQTQSFFSYKDDKKCRWCLSWWFWARQKLWWKKFVCNSFQFTVLLAIVSLKLSQMKCWMENV